jgi:hypothetical protein
MVTGLASSIRVRARKVAGSAPNGSENEIRVTGYTLQVAGAKTPVAEASSEAGEPEREMRRSSAWAGDASRWVSGENVVVAE